MVGRKVLDGLRKGKKDVYALNVQYVKRYRLLLAPFTQHLPSQLFFAASCQIATHAKADRPVQTATF